MASSDSRHLGITHFMVGDVEYHDITSATLTTSGNLLGSSTEGDTFANHFAQVVEKSKTLSVQTFSAAGANILRSALGSLVSLEFHIPKAANSTEEGSSLTDIKVSTGGDNLAMVTSVTFSAGTSAEGTYTIEFTMKATADGAAGLSTEMANWTAPPPETP